MRAAVGNFPAVKRAREWLQAAKLLFFGRGDGADPSARNAFREFVTSHARCRARGGGSSSRRWRRGDADWKTAHCHNSCQRARNARRRKDAHHAVLRGKRWRRWGLRARRRSFVFSDGRVQPIPAWAWRGTRVSGTSTQTNHGGPWGQRIRASAQRGTEGTGRLERVSPASFGRIGGEFRRGGAAPRPTD